MDSGGKSLGAPEQKLRPADAYGCQAEMETLPPGGMFTQA